ncbi:MAG: radical SAM family heme chaperone HemW [Lachnospiraceae bacterium]
MKQVTTQLYIHIPFCKRKCEYCDFLSQTAGLPLQEQYVQALIQEIENHPYRQQISNVTTIFMGGGTPSILKPEWIQDIVRAVANNFSILPEAEISIECNPGTTTPEALEQYRKIGINRISFGLQSAKNRELKELGRIHTYEEFLTSYKQARAAGFSNINVDLMSALPGQTLSSYCETLECVLELQPEHISAYSLIIEEHTPFYEKYREDDRIRSRGGTPKRLPDEDTERLMYEQTEEKLNKQGYRRYEISNYAKQGYECRHNIGYWRRENYLGFGLGAASLFCNRRWKNTEDMKSYLTGETITKIEELSKESQMEEFFFLGLRMTQGIKKEDFFKEFSESIEDRYGKVVEQLQENNLLQVSEEGICFTEYGRDISNYVLAQFLIE